MVDIEKHCERSSGSECQTLPGLWVTKDVDSLRLLTVVPVIGATLSLTDRLVGKVARVFILPSVRSRARDDWVIR